MMELANREAYATTDVNRTNMIYIATALLIFLMHVIHHYGSKGNRLAIRVEKITVFLAAISLLCAIITFCGNAHHYFNLSNRGVLIDAPIYFLYPLGIIVFVVSILTIFPKPINRD